MTFTFSVMCFDETPFTCQWQKEDKNSYGLQILHFYLSFSNGIMVVKLLIPKIGQAFYDETTPFTDHSESVPFLHCLPEQS